MVCLDDYEACVFEAVYAYTAGLFITTTTAAARFSVKSHTIQQCLQGIPSKLDHAVTHSALNSAQEQALFEYIEHLNSIGISPTPRILQSTANQILSEENHVVGPNWIGRFLRRNPQLHTHRQQPLAAEHRNAHNTHDLQSHFKQYKITCREHSIL